MVVYSPLDFTPAEAPPPLPPAVGSHTLAELLAFVRDAEQKLTAAGLTDLGDQIHALRGIYYGTTWSLDYQQNKSDSRNLAFNQFLTYSLMPPDVRPILGPTLFTSLYECAEFKLNSSIDLDFGHLVIGLDARRSYQSRKSPNLLAAGRETGLAVCTWLGDLGGAAGQLAYLRATKMPNRRAIEEFKGSNFGGPPNLEGDIAALVVGAPLSPLDDVPPTPDTGRLSDLVATYCQVGSPTWQARVATFLQLLGAEVSGNSILNVEKFRQELSLSCQRFGESYLHFRAYSQLNNASIVLADSSRHLVGTSHEIADIFIDLMLRSLRAPAGALARATLDPAPTPKGPPFGRYESPRRRLESLERRKVLKEVSDWLELWPK